MKAKQILEYLKEHDLIAIERLERKCNIPVTSLNRSLRTGKLPEKYIPILTETLKDYGLKIKTNFTKTSTMKTLLIIFSCLLFVACEKDDSYKPTHCGNIRRIITDSLTGDTLEIGKWIEHCDEAYENVKNYPVNYYRHNWSYPNNRRDTVFYYPQGSDVRALFDLIPYVSKVQKYQYFAE